MKKILLTICILILFSFGFTSLNYSTNIKNEIKILPNKLYNILGDIVNPNELYSQKNYKIKHSEIEDFSINDIIIKEI